MVTETGTLKITDFGLARVCEEMVAVRPELPDGSIPLDDSAAPQAIIWTDPRDWQAHGPASQTSASTIDRPPVKSRPNQSPARNALTPRRPPTTVDKDTTDSTPTFETANPRLTRTGARLGTGAYMAPEQFRDPKSVDVRADIYAFGVVLFEMITGELPFKGRSMDALDRQHSLYPPPSIVPSVPSRHAKLGKSIDAIVQRCLKKEPADRFHSIAEMRQALKELLAQLRK
jgi:serine/threonine protein kinase